MDSRFLLSQCCSVLICSISHFPQISAEEETVSEAVIGAVFLSLLTNIEWTPPSSSLLAKRERDLCLSDFRQVHNVLEHSPLAKTCGALSSVALGMFSAQFGANDRGLLVSWSSHRLLARPAQNAVSSNFLWPCIIFPHNVYNCMCIWSSCCAALWYMFRHLMSQTPCWLGLRSWVDCFMK